MPEDTEKWKSSITKVGQNSIVTKGYRQGDLIGQVSFAGVVYLVLRGELPTKEQERMMDAIIVASIDHGVNAPTALASRVVASGGVPLPTAVSAGLLAIGDSHGGAIEKCAKLLLEGVARSKESKTGIDETAKGIVAEAKAKKQRLPGFGHRLHTDDPRTKKLMALAKELKLAGEHVSLAVSIQKHLAAEGKELPINVDGAIAAITADMGFDWRMGKGFFLIGRAAGLVAQVYEEQSRQKPMRHIAKADYDYDGPPERDLPEGRR